MARAVSRERRASPPSIKDLVKAKPSTAMDGLAMLITGLAAGLVFAFNPPARDWVVESLGYGLIPTGLWLAAALITVRYHTRSLAKYWRRWTIAGALVTISLGVLSLFRPYDGILADASLGGYWGSVLGGPHLGLAALKLAAICLFMPLLLYPWRAGRVYLNVIQKMALGLQYGITYLYLGTYHVVQFMADMLGAVFNQRQQRRITSLISGVLYWASLADLRARAKAVGERRYLDRHSTGSVESSIPWAGDEPDSSFETNGQEPPPWEPKSEVASPRGSGSKWPFPYIDNLSPPVDHEHSQAPLEEMARQIERTLAEHGVAVEVKDIKAGPRVVRFGLVPGWTSKKGEGSKEDGVEGRFDNNRVKVASILTREKDLALALKTPYLRIEAPVPGEALVGLEVPSPSPRKVHLRDVMESQAFRNVYSKGSLPVALGQDTGGNPVVTDLATLPHLLIAGATGSGKSVCINSIVVSLLVTRPPSRLRFMMVDPKRVELTPFNGIPHLIEPVIVDVDRVNKALHGLMREMFRRYKLMEEMGTRNIGGYNAKSKDRLPYLVLIVDELADLMLAGGFEVEQSLVRLAQLGRATGIHLVLATQRPSVNVVTGLIKANVPARVAFAVTSQVDSRVILDTVGADKLLGKGDMLVLSPESPKPRRVQGTLVYDEEVDELVRFWSNQSGPPAPAIIMDDPEEEDEVDGEVDERMLEQARELALGNPRLSSSFLQRRFKIGGERADTIMVHLDAEGLVIPR